MARAAFLLQPVHEPFHRFLHPDRGSVFIALKGCQAFDLVGIGTLLGHALRKVTAAHAEEAVEHGDSACIEGQARCAGWDDEALNYGHEVDNVIV